MNFLGGNFSESKPVGKINKLTVYTAQVFLSSSQRHDAAPNTKPTLCLTLDPNHSALQKCFPWSQMPQVPTIEDTIKSRNRWKYFQNILKDKHWNKLALNKPKEPTKNTHCICSSPKFYYTPLKSSSFHLPAVTKGQHNLSKQLFFKGR